MGSFTVDLAELEDKIRQMTAFEQTVSRTLAGLDASVERLHESWTGQAAAAHREAHRKLTEGLREMNAGLADIRAAATRAHGNYTSAGRTNVSMWAAVR
jgi:WXG100 family type VII secretion target